MNKLLDLVFENAEAAHRQHLVSLKYSEHMALGEFYEGARTAVDAVVESAIGLELPVDPDKAVEMLPKLEEGYVKLVEMRDNVCQGATVLESLFDVLLEQYTTAIYKLRRFK